MKFYALGLGAVLALSTFFTGTASAQTAVIRTSSIGIYVGPGGVRVFSTPYYNPYYRNPVNPYYNPYYRNPVNPYYNPYYRNPVNPYYNPYYRNPFYNPYYPYPRW